MLSLENSNPVLFVSHLLHLEQELLIPINYPTSCSRKKSSPPSINDLKNNYYVTNIFPSRHHVVLYPQLLKILTDSVWKREKPNLSPH